MAALYYTYYLHEIQHILILGRWGRIIYFQSSWGQRRLLYVFFSKHSFLCSTSFSLPFFLLFVLCYVHDCLSLKRITDKFQGVSKDMGMIKPTITEKKTDCNNHWSKRQTCSILTRPKRRVQIQHNVERLIINKYPHTHTDFTSSSHYAQCVPIIIYIHRNCYTICSTK